MLTLQVTHFKVYLTLTITTKETIFSPIVNFPFSMVKLLWPHDMTFTVISWFVLQVFIIMRSTSKILQILHTNAILHAEI